jgi:hypothetical protein
MNEFDYYLIERKGDKAYPLIAGTSGSAHTYEYLEKRGEYIENPQKMEFSFCKPIPRKPVIGDYFSETESVVSEKIKNVLESMHIKGIQLIPAKVESNKGDIYENFYYIHIYNIIEAMDKENSKFEYEYEMYYIDSFTLDNKVLEKIPLEERLVFKLKEDITMKLYHKSVADAIMATNPEGVQFIKVEDWRL